MIKLPQFKTIPFGPPATEKCTLYKWNNARWRCKKQKQKCTKFQNLLHWSPPASATGGEKEISALVGCTLHYSTLHTVLCTVALLHTGQCTPVTQSEPFQSFSSWKTLQQLIVVFRSFNVSNVYFCVFLSILLLHILVLVDYSDFNNEHLICSACHWEMFVAGFFCSAEMH